MDSATFVPGKRKYLFCTDEKGGAILQSIIDQVVDKNLSFEMVFIGKVQFTDLVAWLSEQRMGSYLYIAAHWNQLKTIKQLAEEIGFSEEEAQYIGYGEKEKNVFCGRCHGITTIDTENTEQVEVDCIYCNLRLEISNHYSRLRDAYLGYVAKL
ncbi:dimethylamine monooxygenase subunit DmmA family protein [Neobacillus drentensis]|uniref:dimethylamine monooxygenase subunit DmmA family protein n=1 Tax=Neobacillus drentensis TaxID=220684 RepID=UPI002FFFC226